MANTLTDVMPKILGRAHLLLRKKLLLPRLVNTDWSDEAAMPGDTIDVPLPASYTATDVTPAATPPTPADTTPTKVQIPLSKHKHADFFLADTDLMKIEKEKHFLPMQTEAAVDALARIVNTDIFAEYKGVFGYVGTAGTTPFASDITGATLSKKTLNRQLCPKGNRRFVLDHDAEANALNLAPFRDASQSADANVITEGEVGRKLGFDWFSDDDVPTHTAGTGASATTNNAGYAIGIKTVTLASAGTGTILVGDIITFAGHTQTYVVTSGDADVSNGGTISFYPGLQVALAASTIAITLKASHVVNLAFHREAFAFATRPIADAVRFFKGGSEISSLTDPQTGITLRLEVMRQYKQTAWDFDISYGVKLVRPELASRLAG
ncbi:MAG TPA: P22 phage major capsid protein family protein [Planctomycetota bacterium]|nr:P22 phage major capsid protein family protein [Planctomycetota bacterium]